MNQSDSTGIVQTIANNEDKAQDMKNAAQKSQAEKLISVRENLRRQRQVKIKELTEVERKVIESQKVKAKEMITKSNKRSAEKAQELLRNGKSQIESSLRDAESFLLNLI